MSTVDSILLRISPSRRWSSWSQICVGTVDSMPLCLSQSRRRSSWSQVCVMMQSQICKNITTILVLLTTVPLLSDSDFSSFRAHVSNSFAKFLRSLFYQFIHSNVTRFINSFTINVTLRYSMPSRVEVAFTHSRTWSARLWFPHVAGTEKSGLELSRKRKDESWSNVESEVSTKLLESHYWSLQNLGHTGNGFTGIFNVYAYKST